MNVILLGNGAWGSAVASLFKENGHAVTFWEKGNAIQNGSVVFSAIPTQAMREVLSNIKSVREIIFINGAKGIERETHLLPYQITKQILPDCTYFTLMGPSFAEEVQKKMPTLVNLGYHNFEAVRKIKTLLQTDYFRIKLTKSIRSLELSAAFKNIYAIACGVAEGLGYGVNTRVKLIILALEEMRQLIEALDFKIDDNSLPATIGDLILTCSSAESRNFSFGKFIASNPIKKSLSQVGATVEGYYTVESVPYFEKNFGLQLPLANFVYEVTHSRCLRIHELFKEFVKITS